MIKETAAFGVDFDEERCYIALNVTNDGFVEYTVLLVQLQTQWSVLFGA